VLAVRHGQLDTLTMFDLANRIAVDHDDVASTPVAPSAVLTGDHDGRVACAAVHAMTLGCHPDCSVRLPPRAQAALRRVVPVSTSSANSDAGKAAARPGLSVAQLLAAKGTRPIRSLDELAADTFESDEDLEEFLAFTYAERHRDLA